MNEDKDNPGFVDAVTRGLKQSTEELDTGILSKLALIRCYALDKHAKKTFQWWHVATGAMATACIVVLLYSMLNKPNVNATYFEQDIELFSTSDSLDLYEDLEFYVWLEEHEIST